MLNKLAEEIHKNAVDKGFWEKPVEVGTSLMLIVSELGEALEADRKGDFADLDWRQSSYVLSELRQFPGICANLVCS